MRLPLKSCGLFAAVMLLSACGSQQGAGTSQLPLAQGAGSSNAAQSFAGSQNAATRGETEHLIGANVRRSCAVDMRPEYMTCDALVRTDIVGGAKPDISGYGPADLQAAYNLPSSTDGSGVTVAIVDAYGYPTAAADLAAYRTQWGLPACTTSNGCLTLLNQFGKKKLPHKSNPGWDEEQALDVDMVSAACPNCKIMLVEANSASFKSLGTAVDTAVTMGATVVSNSYSGSCSGKKASECGDKWYNHPGVVVLASAGDSGYWGAGVNNVPAGLPEVVAVGGTTLHKGGSGRGWTETVWGRSAGGEGTGSGCTSFTKPSWQTDTGCTGRTANDVAAVGDPNTGVAVYYNGKWLVFGGTSVSSPLNGGIFGLANNSATLTGAQSFYTNTADLYDVTSGANGTCTPSYICTGGVGYDGPTGNGTPNGIGAY